MTDVRPLARAFAGERLVPAGEPGGPPPGPLPPGLRRWWLPPALGGLTLTEAVDVVDELAYGDAGYAFSALVSVIGANLTWLYGEPGLAERLPELADRGGSFATAASELEAGSELDRMTTTAVHKGDSVVLTGEKLFSTNAADADYLLVAARSEGAGSDAPPYSLVVVPAGTDGVSVGERWNTSGLRSSPVHPVSFSDCRVPVDKVLRGHGLRLLEVGLNASRVLIAATAVGIVRRARDLSIQHAATRTVGGAPLTAHPLYGDKLARIEVDVLAMRALCRAAAADYDAVMAGSDPAGVFALRGALKTAVAAKVFCGRAGWAAVSAASELFGGLGYTDAAPIGRLLSDVRHVSIVEGGDAVLHDLLYRRHVLPRVRRA